MFLKKIWDFIKSLFSSRHFWNDPSLYAQAEYLRARGPIESSHLDMHREGELLISRLEEEDRHSKKKQKTIKPLTARMSFSIGDCLSMYARDEFLRPSGPLESSPLDMHQEGLLEIERQKGESKKNNI